MTFFGWPSWPAGRAGSGQVTTVSFAVPADSLEFWGGRLRTLDVESRRTSRFGADALVLADADGIELELVGDTSPDFQWLPWPDSPVDRDHAIRGFHSVTMTVAEPTATADLLVKTMCFRKSSREGRRTRFETGAGGQGAILDVVESPEGPEGEESIGTVHHVAWRASDAAHQAEWRETLVK